MAAVPVDNSRRRRRRARWLAKVQKFPFIDLNPLNSSPASKQPKNKGKRPSTFSTSDFGTGEEASDDKYADRLQAVRAGGQRCGVGQRRRWQGKGQKTLGAVHLGLGFPDLFCFGPFGLCWIWLG
ncbi:uncharacterized protein LOC105774975 [Gossypium raimondii]|uniref:Uncharacterized protein n=1 Tax=Gossypium hirsutum TaxID=3635 RepID=A0A1U8KIK0_GOSHI|nr:uncharacterized protein LOC105774975 [Gossypium raimondii]XP_016700778.1 uncharacterized protein LOC107916126 [Gossypium hirsutum]